MKQISVYNVGQYLESISESPDHIVSIKSLGDNPIEFKATLSAKEATKIAKAMKKTSNKTNKEAAEADEEVGVAPGQETVNAILPEGGFAKVKSFPDCSCENCRIKLIDKVIYEHDGLLLLADKEDCIICKNEDTPENRETMKDLFAEVHILPAIQAVLFLAEQNSKKEEKIEHTKSHLLKLSNALKKKEAELEEIEDVIVQNFKEGK